MLRTLRVPRTFHVPLATSSLLRTPILTHGPLSSSKSLHLVTTRTAHSSTPVTAAAHQPHVASSSTPSRIAEAHVDTGAGVVRLVFSDGVNATVDGIWLRDHCSCALCSNHSTLQRSFDSADLPLAILPISVKVSSDGTAIDVMWPAVAGVDANTAKPKHSRYTAAWLHRFAYNVSPPINEKSPQVDLSVVDRRVQLWDNVENVHTAQDANFPSVPYDAVMSDDAAVAQWLANVERHGLGFIDNSPATTDATRALGERICFIRETHFGRFWEVTANNKHGDTAYSNVALPAHTDTTYFSDPIALQLFHVTGHEGEGGLSLYVDGFRAAAELRHKLPRAFDVLVNTKLSAHCAGDLDTYIEPATPFSILTLHPTTGRLLQVRYNTADRSVLCSRNGEPLTSGAVRDFYWALAEFSKLLRAPRNEFWIRNEPGKPVLVDNWRVLHGRSAFTGLRTLCGSYHNRDDYISRLRVLSNRTRATAARKGLEVV